MRTVTACLITGLALAGCAQGYTLQNQFDPKEVAWIHQTGQNRITGQAFLKTQGGDVRTCAGFKAVLVPASAYARERMVALYGNDQQGLKRVFDGRTNGFTNDNPDYLTYTRQVSCDAGGNFSFTDLPDGDYFVVAEVTWSARQYEIAPEGGIVMRRTAVKGGEEKRVILSY